MRTAFLLSVSLAIRLFAAGPVAGVLPSPLLVSGSGRCYLLRPDGTVAWEKKGCGSIHRAYVRGPHVYWSNGDIFRTEIATGATSLFYSPAPKEGAFGFDIRPSGNVVVAVGTADFDAGSDASADEVFQRADDLMYKEKATLKAEG